MAGWLTNGVVCQPSVRRVYPTPNDFMAVFGYVISGGRWITTDICCATFVYTQSHPVVCTNNPSQTSLPSSCWLQRGQLPVLMFTSYSDLCAVAGDGHTGSAGRPPVSGTRLPAGQTQGWLVKVRFCFCLALSSWPPPPPIRHHDSHEKNTQVTYMTYARFVQLII